ncbi:MAG: helix-turn-helix transcriptional regulator, partial [Saccharothrix sp.]|nr:helix-turn-helix transcriptional regulator [Saccharothrix sp.]
KALSAAAELFASAGDRSSARAALSHAVDVHAELGADWDSTRLLARLREHGIRRGPHAKHRRATHGWESLTPMELKVTELVAAGLSNRQVGERLFLSGRTVATHVSHVLAKLGVRSRTDIAREAVRHLGASG